MATRPYGAGVAIDTIVSDLITPVRPISGNGLTVWVITTNYAYNADLDDYQPLTVINREGGALNRIISFEISDPAGNGWLDSHSIFLTNDNTVGTTYSTKTALVAASSTGDIGVLYPVDSTGSRTEESATVTIGIAITIESDTIGEKHIHLANAATTRGFTVTAGTGGVFRDLIFITSLNGIFVSGGTHTFERILISSGIQPTGAGLLAFSSTSAVVVTCNNMIIQGTFGAFHGQNSGGNACTLTLNHCEAVQVGSAAYTQVGTATCTSTNCISADNTGTGWVGTWGGDNNVSTGDGTAPGASSLQNQSVADLFLAFYHLPNRPFDFRPVENASSILRLAGKDQNIEFDYNGFAYHVTTPNIGPCSGAFTGFAAAATASLVPVLAFVSKTATTVTFAVTNTGGKTVEVFSWLPNATVGISGGTRVGNGNITVTPLVEGTAYRFTAAVQD